MSSGARNRILLAFAPRKFPEPPLQPVGPVDEVKMADADQCALVVAPLA
jgi:hypothetical protein